MNDADDILITHAKDKGTSLVYKSIDCPNNVKGFYT